MIVDKRMKKDLRAQENRGKKGRSKSKPAAKSKTTRYKRRRKVGKRKR